MILPGTFTMLDGDHGREPIHWSLDGDKVPTRVPERWAV